MSFVSVSLLCPIVGIDLVGVLCVVLAAVLCFTVSTLSYKRYTGKCWMQVDKKTLESRLPIVGNNNSHALSLTACNKIEVASHATIMKGTDSSL